MTLKAQFVIFAVFIGVAGASSAFSIFGGFDDEGARRWPNDVALYPVRPGDTLSQLARDFCESPSAIAHDNHLQSSTTSLEVGQLLAIRPVFGILYTVKNDESVAGIASHFNASASDIECINDIKGYDLVPGQNILIPEEAAGD